MPSEALRRHTLRRELRQARAQALVGSAVFLGGAGITFGTSVVTGGELRDDDGALHVDRVALLVGGGLITLNAAPYVLLGTIGTGSALQRAGLPGLTIAPVVLGIGASVGVIGWTVATRGSLAGLSGHTIAMWGAGLFAGGSLLGLAEASWVQHRHQQPAPSVAAVPALVRGGGGLALSVRR